MLDRLNLVRDGLNAVTLEGLNLFLLPFIQPCFRERSFRLVEGSSPAPSEKRRLLKPQWTDRLLAFFSGLEEGFFVCLCRLRRCAAVASAAAVCWASIQAAASMAGSRPVRT